MIKRKIKKCSQHRNKIDRAKKGVSLSLFSKQENDKGYSKFEMYSTEARYNSFKVCFGFLPTLTCWVW